MPEASISDSHAIEHKEQLKKKCSELQDDLDEGDVTIKGFCKKKLIILDTILPTPIKENAQVLISTNKEGKLSDGQLLQTFNKLFDKFLINGTESNGVEDCSTSAETKKCAEKEACIKITKADMDACKDIKTVETTPEVDTKQQNGKALTDEEMDTSDAEKGKVLKDKKKTKDFDTEHQNGNAHTDEEMDTLDTEGKKAGKGKRKSTGKADKSNQPSILSMFNKVKKRESDGKSPKRKLESDDDVKLENKPEKREKINNDESVTENIHANTNGEEVSAVDTIRCRFCKQITNDSDKPIKKFSDDIKDSVEEMVALTDKKLSMFSDDDDGMDYEEKLTYKLTQFSIYDNERHLCPVDTGLIDSDVELYLSGYMKTIDSEDPRAEGGIPVRKLGPLIEWWITGYDGGARPVIGVSTAFAEYYLMEPSPKYQETYNVLAEKALLHKIMIEFLNDNYYGSYEDLVIGLESTSPPAGLPPFSEEQLLRHAQFLCDQVHNYDEGADDGDEDDLLITAPAIVQLINMAGVLLGKRDKEKNRGIAKKKPGEKKPMWTNATTTHLVRYFFDEMFKEQIGVDVDAKVKDDRRKRCGVCEVCLGSDCGKCKACKDMTKFGGSGKSKQCCTERKCPNMLVADADADNEDDDDEAEQTITVKDKLMSDKHNKNRKVKSKDKSAITWLGDPSETTKDISYYKSVRVNGEVITVGDAVLVESDDSEPYVAKIVYMFQSKGSSKKFHVHWMMRSTESFLGGAADPRELFITDDCEDILVSSTQCKARVIYKPPMQDWHQQGGREDFNVDAVTTKDDDENTFFYQKWYDADLARIEDVPEYTVGTDDRPDDCGCCQRINTLDDFRNARLGDKLGEKNKNGVNLYKSVKWQGKDYNVGDAVFLTPDSFRFKIKPEEVEEVAKKKKVDETMYPEYYRKSDGDTRGTKLLSSAPPPFQIGYIKEIACAESDPDAQDIKLRVYKYYRPENTHLGRKAAYSSDLNMLYWSQEESVVQFSVVRGLVTVAYDGNLLESVEDWSRAGPHRFYFHLAYSAEDKEFTDPPEVAKKVGIKGKGEVGKGKGKQKAGVASSKDDTYPKITKRLKGMDIFAGCGGLSEGFHQAGASETAYAVEIISPAAKAYQLNNAKATVFTDDCNELLRLVMDGSKTNKNGQVLPQKGDVELLCGGPPCQGFSGMNRFNLRQYSQFKNSLVVSYLSYCDYYRPRYFVLENVRNFVSYKQNVVLKLVMRCLLRMGYQCTFGVLQAGAYGVPQTRRRTIILAAAPGEVLPYYPEPLHSFLPSALKLSVDINGRKYEGNIQWLDSAPYRPISVKDALYDLPTIKNGAKVSEMEYSQEPISHWQKMIRGNSKDQVLRDHVCKDMNALVVARMERIPTAPGSDWRDLPNISVKLPDGKQSNKLKYTRDDPAVGRSRSGALRGVCACASEGRGKCDPQDRQQNTLIPWCLPHTGNRHNQWSGLYGRLQWEGLFKTTLTNPEPMGKQGKVLHPEQSRVLSVRECARSQGFPDTYKFYGSVLDKHRQVGNAVPPPLARAIGHEIRKSLYKVELKKQAT